jgi:integration host factor subunit alpha
MAGRTITRADLSEAVYQKVGLSRTESAALVELVLSEISDCVARVMVFKPSNVLKCRINGGEPGDGDE